MICQSKHRFKSLNQRYTIKKLKKNKTIGVTMQDLTPSGKTTVETADSAIMSKNHNPEEVAAASALRKSAVTSTNDHSEQVTFKLLHAMASHPKDNFSSRRFIKPPRPCESPQKCTKIIFSRTDHRV